MGGTHREGDRSGFGRYGFGLPSAAVSISKRFTVYSRVPGGSLHAVTVDLQKISSGQMTNREGVVTAPPATQSELPQFVRKALPKGELAHGTVIVLDSLDRLSPGFVSAQKFQAKVLEHLGLIYRGLLRTVHMRVIDLGKPNGETIVDPIDPLFLTPGARYYDDTAIVAEALPIAQFKVKEEGTRGRELGTVRVRYSYLPYGFQDGSDGRLAIMKESNGLVMLRAGRQIDVVTKIPFDGFHMVNYDRNWGVEIDFEPTLDEEFGVTTNKPQITISDRMWDILKDKGKLLSSIKELRKRFKVDKDKADAEKGKSSGKKTSEAVMEEASKFRTRKPAPLTPEKEQKQRNALEEEVSKQVKTTGREETEIRAEILGQAYKVEFEDLPGAPFYRVEQVGGQKRLKINTRHRLYSDIYNDPNTSPRVRSALEILLFVVGECELDSDNDRERFYTGERAEWSRQFDVTLDLYNKKDSVIDALSAKDEDAAADAGQAASV